MSHENRITGEFIKPGNFMKHTVDGEGTGRLGKVRQACACSERPEVCMCVSVWERELKGK